MYIRKLWIAALLAMLLVANLAGEAGARERAVVSARKYVTIPAGHFHTHRDGTDWYNYGDYMEVNSGTGHFVAPVVFPGSGPVTVKKVILYAYDNNVIHDVQLFLHKTTPASGGDTEMAYVYSTSASATDPREFSDTTITYATIQRTHGAYLYLQITDAWYLRVYGVKIAYTG